MVIAVLRSSDSPLLWLRADPEMEYLAEIHFNQPVQMWVSLERSSLLVALLLINMFHTGELATF